MRGNGNNTFDSVIALSLSLEVTKKLETKRIVTLIFMETWYSIHYSIFEKKRR